jgi:nitroreductase
MDLYDLLISRRTVRRFQARPIEAAILDKLVDAARLAPSAANRQPCEFLVVDDSAEVEAVFPLVKWAAYIAPEGTPVQGERPVAYILVLINRNHTPAMAQHDAAAGAMTIIYAALAHGIGSCWMGAIDRQGLQRLFDIPEHCTIDSLVALGYPAESPVVEPLKDSLRYWKDEEGTLHVPKRALADVLHRNRYE